MLNSLKKIWSYLLYGDGSCRLDRETALRIYDILRSSSDDIFHQNLDRALKARSESLSGLYPVADSKSKFNDWSGTTLPPDVRRPLLNSFDVNCLFRKNLLSEDGERIDLSVLANALPVVPTPLKNLLYSQQKQ